MQVLNFAQGSPEWHEHRRIAFNASEAPAMMGCSPYETREQLLARKFSGIEPEITPAQQAIFDEGHRTEALARPLAEKIIGDDLYPITGSIPGPDAVLSASFDGLTLDRKAAFEHKSLNNTLREIMVDGCTGTHLPMLYQIQMQQQCMVSGCERVLFVASKWAGDELDEMRYCWYEPNEELNRQIMAAWGLFADDKRDYRPAVAQQEPKPTADVIEALPALAVQIEGRVLQTNLPYYRHAAEEMISRVNTNLQTDADFVNAAAVITACSEGEKRLAACKEQALGQTSSIDELFRTIDAISEMLRNKRLELAKLVEARKTQLRTEIAQHAMGAIQLLVAELNERVGQKWVEAPSMAVITDAMKNKKTVESWRAAADAAAVQAKAKITVKADRMLKNHQTIAPEHMSLFPDFALVGDKAPEDFQALMQLRIANHEKAQAALARTSPVVSVTQVTAPQTAVAAALSPTKTEATAVDVIQRAKDAMIEGEHIVRDFIASRTWENPKQAGFVRAVLIEFLKFRMRSGAVR